MWRYLLFFFFLLFFNVKIVLANSDSSYVLPYPSVLPGSKFYNLNQFYYYISKFWYFGDYGNFVYYLKLSDKYLVEAKVLFEYKQYLLGYNALRKSDVYFIEASKILNVRKNGSEEKKHTLKLAAKKHYQTLIKVSEELPEKFNWNEEKKEVKKLELKRNVGESLLLRQKYE